MAKRVSQAVAVASLVVAAAAASPAGAQVCSPELDGRIANPVYGDTAIAWEPIVEYERMVLTIGGPCEDIVRVFRRGEPIVFDIREIERVQDGAYRWELRREAPIDAATKKSLAVARATGDDSIWWDLWQQGSIPQGPYVDSEAFQVSKGVIVPPGGQEEGSERSMAAVTEAAVDVAIRAASFRSAGVGARAERDPLVSVTAADQVIPDDLIVQGSECVGLDCVNNENFSFDTIRLKENNLRIHFDDTSTIAGYPANDWRLIANDSASGGSSKFSIEDITGGKVPFTVEAGATTNSIFVDSTGRVGFRTSTPVLDLHVSTSNTPAIRLEQTNAGGFTAQTWDIGANEANFFVRDVTGGSKLSFRIRPGAPTSSIDISADGDVGIGTASPALQLHVQAADAGVPAVRVTNTSATGFSGVEYTDESGTGTFLFAVDNSANNTRINSTNLHPMVFLTESAERLRIASDGNVGIACNAPASDLVIASGGGCSTPSSSINAGATNFTAASSRTFKENLSPVAVPGILDKIAAVDVYNYDFKQGPKDRIGLMAEDFHQIFGRGSEKYINGDEVQMALWLAVKELTAENQRLAERLAALETQLASEKKDSP